MTRPDPSEIEAQLARDRVALAQSVAALRHSFSAGPVMAGLMKVDTTRYSRAIDTAVRRHPMAWAVVGAGLAWALLGRKSGDGVKADGLSGTKYEALSRWEDEGGPAVPLDEPDLKWVSQAETLRDRASAALAQLEGKLASAAELAQERAAILAALARDVRQSMRSGLGHLSVSAQDKIVAAREAAYAAQLNARHATGKMIEDHPFAAAGLALAAGAVIGLSLPRTKHEDRVLGPERDRLLDETRRLLAEERQRAVAAMEALAGGR